MARYKKSVATVSPALGFGTTSDFISTTAIAAVVAPATTTPNLKATLCLSAQQLILSFMKVMAVKFVII